VIVVLRAVASFGANNFLHFMKHLFALFTVAAVMVFGKMSAQQQIQLDSTADFGKWSAWFADTVKGDDGTLYTWEYRYAAVKRKGIAVYYEFEIKNTGATKLNGRIHFTYYDLLVKSDIGADESFKVKPGETGTVTFIQQGCKKKDKKKDDYKACLDCPLSYTFYISTK
jgi:hypothetical protein